MEESKNLNMDDTSANKKRKIDGDSKPKKVYPCDKCKYSSSILSNLKTHTQSIHKGIRFPCDQCEYAATQHCHLKNTNKSNMKESDIPVISVILQQLSSQVLKGIKKLFMKEGCRIHVPSVNIVDQCLKLSIT